MRLWHKGLIPALPRQQLFEQWRDCCLIAKKIAEKGTPGHILVNRIMDYPLSHFRNYVNLVANEMERRGYKCRYGDCIKYIAGIKSLQLTAYDYEIFPGWHNDRYMEQCFYNLQEQYDCGGISEEEWSIIGELLHDRFVDLYIKRGKE